MKFRQRGGRAPAAGGIEQKLGHDRSSGVGYHTEVALAKRETPAAHRERHA
jgi:hypothetical protein